MRTKIVAAAMAATFLSTAAPASAVTIIDDFSQLGSVYANAAGQLFNAPTAGAVDVTAAFEADANYSASILDKADGASFTNTITITLANLASEQAVGDSSIDSLDANGEPNTSSIRVDDSPSATTYVSANPSDNSLYTIADTYATLGGASVNVGRIGNAVVGSAADGLYDLVTLFTHEMEHSLGYSGGDPTFLALVGPVGSTNRALVVPKSLTGFGSDFSIPIVSGSSHIDGIVNGGLFNNAVVAEPGFGVGQRAELTGLEIYGLCVIDGCTASQVNPNPQQVSAAPEPASWLLMIAGVGLVGAALRRARAVGDRLRLA